MKITILAVGKARTAEEALAAEYIKRIKDKVIIREITAPKNLPPVETQKAEVERLLKVIPPKAFVILLDERGKDLSSRDFATKLNVWRERGVAELVFLIGGANGVTDDVRTKADFILGFGRLTWPHRLVRVMLLEQLYRAQQINAGHPYHRD